MNTRVSIVIPVYNDAPVLPLLFERLGPVVNSLNTETEIICVDDGSSDSSVAVLQNLQKQHPQLRILRLDGNFGQSNAITAGLDKTRGEQIVVMDSDLEDPPEAIVPLLAALENAPLALAQDCSRWEKGSRGISSLLFCLFTRLLTPLAPPLNVGVFRAFSQEGLQQALRNTPPGGTTLSRFYAARVPYVLVPVHRGTRAAGISSYTFCKRFALAVTRICTYHRIPLFRRPHAPYYRLAEVIEA